ncbi:hypothetical protein F5Y19DRAFT_466323 [Xylariaceae sp. FL1651]|nr:hypothetical protein F5Y19DRAFT_466323 [Xylariaceae sp. FL1651]
MSTTKRDRTLGAGEDHATRAKVSKTSHESDSAAAGKLPVQRHSGEVQVTVKIYSDDDREDDYIPMTLLNAFGEERWLKQINSLDSYGRLNPEYGEHEIRKGSGVWGKALNHGDIFMIANIRIEPLWRRQGVGAKLVGAGFFAFVNPMHLTQETVRNDEKLDSGTICEQSEIFKHFFRSLGFRRIGTSGWLAFTDNDSHPSRHLDKAQDWDAPVQLKSEQITPEPIRTILSSLSDPSISGAESVSKMEEVLAVEGNAPMQVYTDEIGNTILHMAAIGRKAEPISYIMSKIPQLAEKRNSDRTRRLGGGVRVVIDVISDSFTGFCQSDIECLAALIGTEIFDLTKLSDRDIWVVSSATDETASRVREANLIRNTLRLKYGCTCGRCIGGFLNPRMRFTLLCHAEIQYDTLNDNPGPHRSHANWLESNSDVLDHLPRAVQQDLVTDKSMRQGFINMCQHVDDCLRKKWVPNTAAILDFYQDEVSECGTVAAVAMMIFDTAISQDEWAGDKTMMDMFEDDINQLPTCRNDHKFGLVRAKCGYEEIFTG